MIMLLSFGVIAYLRKSSEEDFYLAGRGQGVLVTALTGMATMFSSCHARYSGTDLQRWIAVRFLRIEPSLVWSGRVCDRFPSLARARNVDT